MSKNNTTLSVKHNSPEEHHAIKAEMHHALKAQPGHCYCTRCGAIGFQKHWYIDSVQLLSLRTDKSAHAILCPGCTRVDQQQFEGDVVMANSRYAVLTSEILALIKHTEGRCWHHNPMARIGGMVEEKGVVHIQTTTLSLAQRIGKELKKAFKGSLEFKHSPGEQFVRVYWTD